MKTQALCFFVIFISGLLFSNEIAEGAKPSGMFVFGDSYVDTGNHEKNSRSWQPPYGITFPGKPSGRASDGRVLTDFVASFFNISTPIPYNQRSAHPDSVSFGMNFAFGGTGMFAGPPNVSEQIDQLQQLIEQGVYSEHRLSSYVVLLSVSGNDYGFYFQRKGVMQEDELVGFSRSLVKQISAALWRLYNMGSRRFAVTGMGPLGCLPSLTLKSSYKHCNETFNKVAAFHNLLLEEAVNEIRKSSVDARLVILDQYASSMSVLRDPNPHGEFREPLEPCCRGWCGGRDEEGKAVYRMCANRELAFFWDEVHPTQAGWHALTTAFRPALQTLEDTSDCYFDRQFFGHFEKGKRGCLMVDHAEN